MSAHDLTDDVRSGRLEPVELLESELVLLREILAALRDRRTVSLNANDEFATRHLIEGFATVLIANEQQRGEPSRPLIETPPSLAELIAFARTADDLSDREAIVLLNIDTVLGSDDPSTAALDALKAPLEQLFLAPHVWLIVMASASANAALSEHYEYLFHRREDAVRDRFGASVRVREAGKPDRQLFFMISNEEAHQAMDALRKPNTGFTTLLQACLDWLVAAARDNTFEDRDNHTALGGCILLVFEAALPFKPGYLHMLTVDVTGNRYRVSRDYQPYVE